MKKIIALMLVLAVLAPACKKKSTSKKSSSTSTTGGTTGSTTSGTTGGTTGSTTGGTTGGTTTGGTTGGTTTGGTTGNTTGTGTFTNATTFNGFFNTMAITTSYLGFPVSINQVMAEFSATPVSTIGQGIQIGSVLFNGTSLTFTNGSYASDYQSSVNLTTENWTVNGNATIPTFTIANGGGRPSGVNASALPTSVSKSAGLTVNLGTLTNVETGYFILSDGASGIVTIPVQNGPNTINITPAQLSNFATSSNGFVGVTIQNDQGIHILGKNFLFLKDTEIANMISITN